VLPAYAVNIKKLTAGHKQAKEEESETGKNAVRFCHTFGGCSAAGL
jgi:hypothetical protein